MQTKTKFATKLLIQPGSGIKEMLDAIENAQETIHLVIFRFDRGEIETALKRAARRGVFVHALVAYTSAGQGGEATLRKLEMRLLAGGITVTRTAADLVRYHDKLMLIDGKILFLLGFNYTYLDIDRSRSFGIVTREPRWVRESEKLFLADTTRQQYTPECDTFVVSPGNSRRQLTAMLANAKKQLLIYDGKLSDPNVMRLLSEQVKRGVDVRVIGATGKRAVGVKTVPPPMRLHAQVIVRDGEQFFLGSQSLRTLELDARREVGILIDDPELVSQMVATFEADWATIHVATLPVETKHALQTTEIPVGLRLEADDPAAELSVKGIKLAVKEAIKDTLLETMRPPTETVPLKQVVKEAAKEALQEIAL